MAFMKSFFSDTIEGALALAAREFGEDALVVDSRMSPPEYSSHGAYELVVAAPDEHAPRTGSIVRSGSPPIQLANDVIQLMGTMTTLQKEVNRMADCLARLSMPSITSIRPGLAPISAKLLENDVPPDIVHAILESLELEHGPGSPKDNRGEVASAHDVANVFARRVGTGSGLTDTHKSGQIVVFVGPSGAGKTTSLAKLVAEYGLPPGRRVGIITLDTIRPAAIDQLRSCSAICDVPLEVADSSAALRQALRGYRSQDVVFVDTPGCSHHDLHSENELVELLAEIPSSEIHLVLNAAVRTRDVIESVRGFGTLNITHLLFTHLDDTACKGGILSAALRSGLPISFVSGGSRPSARIVVPNILDIANAMFSEERVTISAA